MEPIQTIQDIEEYFQKIKPELEKVLPGHMSIDRFIRICLGELKKDSNLIQCSKSSIGGAAMQAAVHGMEPGILGKCYFQPFNKKIQGQRGQRDQYIKECSFVIGYKGMIDLAYRTGFIESITAEAVHENDYFIFKKGMAEILEHEPTFKNRGPIIAFYAYVRTASGGFKFTVKSIDEMKEHALQYTKQQYNGALSGVWKSNFNGMAKKTLVIELLKYLPKDVIRAIQPRQTEPAADPIQETAAAEPEPETDRQPQAKRPVPETIPFNRFGENDNYKGVM